MRLRDALVWVSMQISTRLLLRATLAMVALTAPVVRAARAISSHRIVASAIATTPAQTAKEPQSQTAKEPQPAKGSQAQTAKEPQAKAVAEFTKLDAATLPIIKKIQIGGDADWLAIGF